MSEITFSNGKNEALSFTVLPLSISSTYTYNVSRGYNFKHFTVAALINPLYII